MALPFLLLAFGASYGASAIKNDIENRAAESKFRIASHGFNLEQQEIDLNMQQLEVASAEQSLFSLKKLREVMSTQNAILGARGQKPGVGSAGTIGNATIGEFNADERARNLSKSFKKIQLENQKSISKLNHIATANKLENSKTRRAFKQKYDLFSKGLNMFTQGFGMNL